MRRFIFSVFVVFLLLAGGCKKEATSPETGGAVEGYVSTKNGKFPLGGVLVYIKENSSKKAYSNSEGYFKITGIPEGQKTVVITTGSINIEKTVDIISGKTVKVSDKNNPLKLGSNLKIAVVYGYYDRIQDILDTVGFVKKTIPDTGAYVLFSNLIEFLNSQYFNDFDIVFINCGAPHEDTLYSDSSLKQKLNNWVNNGHSLYASDWAYTIVEACFPEYINFFGNDSFPGSARIGISMQTTSVINNQQLRNHLGKSSADINFNLGGWVVIKGLEQNSSAEVWITADSVRTFSDLFKDLPIMVYFKYGQGNVLYTSFHNEAQVTDDMVKILIRVIYGL